MTTIDVRFDKRSKIKQQQTKTGDFLHYLSALDTSLVHKLIRVWCFLLPICMSSCASGLGIVRLMRQFCVVAVTISSIGLVWNGMVLTDELGQMVCE